MQRKSIKKHYDLLSRSRVGIVNVKRQALVNKGFGAFFMFK